ncbi:MAG: type II secretion system protein [Bacilli bacterium]|nr:type II secretion system protein [Bacilli bacterium]
MKSHFNFAVKAIKKKGFTLIELLAVIVILAVIALILTPQILSVINEAKEGSLEATKKSIVKASELYVVSNIEDFTLEVGEKAYIQLSELEDGYIKSIKNTSGESCAGYVKVEKTEEDYDYTVYLDCGNGENLLVDSSYVNYGGDYLDEFKDVIETSDGGYLAVGYSNSTTFSDNTRYGDTLNYDAIIVKYDSNGLEEWSHNFGGTGDDYFYSVIDDGSGYVVVGQSRSQDGDMLSLEGDTYNSIIVKYSYNGNLEIKRIINKYSSSSSSSTAYDIIYINNNYYITGDSRYITNGYDLQFIAKYNSSFNQEWIKTYGGTDYNSFGYTIINNTNDDLVTAGLSSSTNNEMADIKIGARGNNDATIFVIDKEEGTVIAKGIFGGTDGADIFYDVVEVDDGYIAVGISSSSDGNMTDISKGNIDAVVVKFSKTADENDILPVMWTKVIGGTNKEYFKKIILKDNQLYLIGYSNSKDGDFSNISKTTMTDYDGIVVKMDLEGNVISKKSYGGSQSDYLNGVLSTTDGLILVGSSFSLDDDMESFNLGNQDAILLSINTDLNYINSFQLETLLMSSQKNLIVDYGTSIPTVLSNENEALKLYTTNDAVNDLGGWCTSATAADPNRNYNSVNCLKPFDNGNIVYLLEGMTISLSNDFVVNPTNTTNWIKLLLSYGNTNKYFMVDNLKIKFNDSNYMTIAEAVDGGYIEPLVLIDSTHVSMYYLDNSFALLSGDSASSDNYASITILIKPTSHLLTNISFESSLEPTISQAYFQVSEFLNFDISLTPNNS